jgi:hypothetical protein
MQKNYHSLIDEKIFFGGAADVEDMLNRKWGFLLSKPHFLIHMI